MKKILASGLASVVALALTASISSISFGQVGPAVKGYYDGTTYVSNIPFASGAGMGAVIATTKSVSDSLAGYLPLTGGILTGNLIGTVISAPLITSIPNGPSAIPAIRIAGGNNTTIGAALQMTGTGTTPSKTIQVDGGKFTVRADDGTTILFGLDNSGNESIIGSLTTLGDINANGNVNVKGTLSSTQNTQPASATNTGVAIGGGPNYSIASFSDSTRTANNRNAQEIFFNGAHQFRFASDDGSAATTWLAASGGQASGITGITSGGPAGAPWTHTGSFSATGDITANGANIISNGKSIIATGAPSTPTNVGVQSSVQMFTGGAANQSTVAYINSANTANNRGAYSQWQGSTFCPVAFANDGFTAGVAAICIGGGYGTGITGITSSSGSGAWVHTGVFTATGNIATTGGNIIAQGAPTTPVNVATTSSVQLFTGGAANQSTVALINSTNTPDNRLAYSQWAGTTFAVAAFANDAFNAGRPIITASGGYASGITGITSNSGTGAWAHTGDLAVTKSVTIGSATPATASPSELALAKSTASGTAPGAGFLKLSAVAGTTAGTCKIIAYAGTSTTPVTLVDNVGSGC